MKPVEEVLAGIPGFASAKIEYRLGAGLTHQSYLLHNNGQRFVLRVDSPNAEALGLDRKREYRLSSRVADAGLCPAWRACDPEQGWSLRAWWPGRSWQAADLQRPENLKRLAALLRRLHALTVPAEGPRESVDRLAPLSRYAHAVGTTAALDLLKQGKKELDGLRANEPAAVICHNDLVCHNLVEANDGNLFLIDFEYAAVGDAFFDLATVLEHHDLPQGLSAEFLQTYLGREATTVESAQLNAWRRYYHCLLQLWELRIDHLA